jgi:hypothetical protein
MMADKFVRAAKAEKPDKLARSEESTIGQVLK